MSDHVLSIAVAFLAYSLLDMGKAFQKIGLAAMRSNRRRGIAIWLGASTATSASSLLILYAVSLGSVLIVGSMAGTGLAAVTLLTVLLMRERVRAVEIAGVACVMIAPFLLASAYAEPPTTPVLVEHLLYFLGALTSAFSVLLFLVRRNTVALGMLLAGAAGTLGGMVILLQKVATSALGRAASFVQHSAASAAAAIPADLGVAEHVLRVFANPYTVAWVGLSLLSTLVLQLSYEHGQAIRLIPSFNGAYILIPILGGTLVFKEPMHPRQWLGVALILGGVALLTFGRPREAEDLQ